MTRVVRGIPQPDAPPELPAAPATEPLETGDEPEKSLEDMTKAELLEHAGKQGIEVSPSAKKAAIIEAIQQTGDKEAE